MLNFYPLYVSLEELLNEFKLTSLKLQLNRGYTFSWTKQKSANMHVALTSIYTEPK